MLDWKAVVGILISAALLWYAFRDVNLAEVWHELRRANMPLLALSGLLVTVPFAFRAVRWAVLLEPVHPGSRFRPRFAATCIGAMGNNLLPARIGEFARAYSLTRLEPIRLSASIGSLVVERLFDGFTILALLLVAVLWPGFPSVAGQGIAGAARWFAPVLVLMLIVLLAMVVRPTGSVRLFERTVARLLPERVRRPVVDALEALLHGMSALRDWRLVLRASVWSLAVWLTMGFGTWVGFMAFDISAPLIAGVFLQSVIALAVALPSAPGFFGVFEAAARVGLVEVWGVPSTPAISFAVGFHLAGFIPVTVIGLYYLWRLGLSWREIEDSEETVETAVESSAGGTQ